MNASLDDLPLLYGLPLRVTCILCVYRIMKLMKQKKNCYFCCVISGVAIFFSTYFFDIMMKLIIYQMCIQTMLVKGGVCGKPLS